MFLDGQDITGLPPYKIVRKGISRTFQLVREGAEAPAQDAVLLEDAVEIARGRMAAGQSASDAARQTARETGLKKGDLYKALLVPPVENEN